MCCQNCPWSWVGSRRCLASWPGPSWSCCCTPNGLEFGIPCWKPQPRSTPQAAGLQPWLGQSLSNHCQPWQQFSWQWVGHTASSLEMEMTSLAPLDLIWSGWSWNCWSVVAGCRWTGWHWPCCWYWQRQWRLLSILMKKIPCWPTSFAPWPWTGWWCLGSWMDYWPFEAFWHRPRPRARWPVQCSGEECQLPRQGQRKMATSFGLQSRSWLIHPHLEKIDR